MKELKDRIKEVCLPKFTLTRDREAIINAALVGWDGIRDIDFEGSASVFTTRLIYQWLPLEQMKLVLEELKSLSGDVYKIDALLAELNQANPSGWQAEMDRSNEFPHIPSDGAPPYKGLNFYDVDDSDLYYGRDKVIRELIYKFRINNSKFLMIVGASGSGKSSLVRAGIIPTLKGRRRQQYYTELPSNSTNWPIHLITPTQNPLKELAHSLAAGSEDIVKSLLENMLKNRFALASHVKQVLATKGQDTRLLLVVDQFEELFTLVEDKDVKERDAFVANLMNAVDQDEGCPILLICTLRADFIPQCIEYESIRSILESNQIYLGPMSREELQETIEGPASNGNWQLDRGLVSTILNDLRDASSPLPFLSEVLLAIWKKRDGRLLTVSAYQEIGGIRNAIKYSGDKFLSQLDQDSKKIVRKIFSKLIIVKKSHLDARRRISIESILEISADHTEQLKRLIIQLADARLVTTDDNKTVEISHESLLTAWPWLRDEIDIRRGFLIWAQEITNAAQEWNDKNRNEEYLWSTARIEPPEDQFWESYDELEDVCQAFIANSERYEKRLNRRTELRNLFQYTLTIIAILAAGASILLYRQLLVRSLAISSRNAANSSQYEESILLAIEATNRGASNIEQVWVDALSENFVEQEIFQIQNDNNIWESGFSWNPLGTKFAASASDDIIRIWDTVTGEEIIQLRGHSDVIGGLDWHPDGQLLVSSSWDESIRIWNTETGEEIRQFINYSSNVTSVAWDPTGNFLASGSANGTIRIWNAQSGSEILMLQNPDGWVSNVAWNPDGSQLATSTWDAIHIWDVYSGELILKLSDHKDEINHIAWHPQGEVIASATGNIPGSGNAPYIFPEIIIWDAETGQMRNKIEKHPGAVKGISWHPSGERLASASIDGTIRIWNVENGEELIKVDGYWYLAVAWHPDGKRIASVSRNSIQLWDLEYSSELVQLEGHEDDVLQVAWNYTGNLVATASLDNSIRIWDARSGDELLQFNEHNAIVRGVAWNPSRNMIASAGIDKTARIWDIDSGEKLIQFDHDGSLGRVIWHPDGSKIATLSFDDNGFIGRSIYVWDLTTESLVIKLEVNGLGVEDISWIPDNGGIAAALYDGMISIIDINSGEIINEIQTSVSSIQSIDWHPNESKFAVASSNGEIQIWNADQKVLEANLEGHTAPVNSVKWHPGGGKIASASDDHLIKIWNMETGRIESLHLGHTAAANSVEWHPDGNLIASASDDSKVLIRRPIPPCNLVKRNLTLTEWRTNFGFIPYQASCPSFESPVISLRETPSFTIEGLFVIATTIVVFALIFTYLIWSLIYEVVTFFLRLPFRLMFWVIRLVSRE